MINKKFGLVPVMMLVFGMAVIGCDTSKTDDGGVVRLTGIPREYNGKYAIFSGTFLDTEELIYGYVAFNWLTNEATAAEIKNGRVTIPAWTWTESEPLKYSGNQTATLRVAIVDVETITGDFYLGMDVDENATIYFDGVIFSNGGVAKSFTENRDALGAKALVGTWATDAGFMGSLMWSFTKDKFTQDIGGVKMTVPYTIKGSSIAYEYQGIETEMDFEIIGDTLTVEFMSYELEFERVK